MMEDKTVLTVPVEVTSSFPWIMQMGDNLHKLMFRSLQVFHRLCRYETICIDIQLHHIGPLLSSIDAKSKHLGPSAMLDDPAMYALNHKQFWNIWNTLSLI
jgi:hypothetical protein